MTSIYKICNPELFQGDMNRRGYFEGWYFKLIDRTMSTAVAVIPGVALGDSPSAAGSHAFVQFILGQRAEYYRFPLSDFQSDNKRFSVGIGGNAFSREGISLNLGQGGSPIRGELAFTGVLPFPKTLCWPGIMGPYGFVPGMECYHGIVSIRHTITGSLKIDGHEVSFDGGTGYIEKDWGRSFPSSWIWLQANHFGEGSAFLFSVADIPWRGSSFRGFFAFLHHKGRLHRFATYTGARLALLQENESSINAALISKAGRLEISARPGPGGLLKAPKNGLMDRLIEESISATVAVRLTDGRGNTIFDGISPCAGMERYDYEKLLQ